MIDKGCYYLLNVSQGSPDWHFLRKGRICSSSLGKIMKQVSYCSDSPEEIALELTGKKKPNFTSEAIKRMQAGTDHEPIIRNYLKKNLKCKIEEYGIGILKSDTRFSASPDGIIKRPGKPDIGLEIKCPAKMYRPLLRYMDKPEDEREEGNYDHIWRGHWLQMQQAMKIFGLEDCLYAVYSIEDEEIFIQIVTMDHKYWDEVIYPTATAYWDRYMKPHLTPIDQGRISMAK